MPTVDYTVPRGVGVTQLAYDLSRPEITRHFTTHELFSDLAANNIRIVKLWLDDNPFDGAGPFFWTSYGTPMGDLSIRHHRDPMFEDMDLVWRDPNIDTIVVRFIGRGLWDASEPDCTGWTGPFWIHEPTYDIASKLLRRYGEQNKTIIITDWEGDNQWACGGTVSMDMAMGRMQYVIRLAEERQAAVQRARDEYPDAVLKVMFGMVVNDLDELPAYYGMNLVKNGIPGMDPQPDVIGLSYWLKHQKPIVEALEYIQLHTGYPMHRIYLDEVGAAEKTPGRQYARLMEVIPPAFDAGLAFACCWMWKQTWHGFDDRGRPINTGMWKWANDSGKVEWLDEPNSGLQAIQEINDDL